MNAALLQKLSVVTDEEKAILAGKEAVNRALYYSPGGPSNEIDSSRVLTNGKLIDIRPNTRFVHFPRHTHSFVEFIYMCSGQTTHFVDGQKIVLKQGDLLFMNQHATQEILPASMNDIGVNFMILPAFFDRTFQMMGNRDNALRDFIISCLTDTNRGGNYLYFQVADVLPVQNLVENLIWLQLFGEKDRRLLSQNTMALLFLSLMNYTDKIHMAKSSWERSTGRQALRTLQKGAAWRRPPSPGSSKKTPGRPSRSSSWKSASVRRSFFSPTPSSRWMTSRRRWGTRTRAFSTGSSSAVPV